MDIEIETRQPPLPLSPLQVQSALEQGTSETLSREKFPYHNWEDHVLKVVDAVQVLGEEHLLTQREIDLIKIAVLHHDFGYSDGAEEHEERSAEIAVQNLREWGFAESDIQFVRGLILATKGEMINGVYETRPFGLPQAIMCDADLGRLGEVDFLDRSEALRIELGEADEILWLEGQATFLERHKYHTDVARKLWDEGKAKNFAAAQGKLYCLKNKVKPGGDR